MIEAACVALTKYVVVVIAFYVRLTPPRLFGGFLRPYAKMDAIRSQAVPSYAIGQSLISVKSRSSRDNCWSDRITPIPRLCRHP